MKILLIVKAHFDQPSQYSIANIQYAVDGAVAAKGVWIYIFEN